MIDTKKKPIPLPQGDQEFLDDFQRQWNDGHAQLHPLVDISPEGIDALFHEAEQRRHTQAVHRRRTAYSIAASVALLLGVGGTLYRQLAVDQPGPLVAENVMEPTICDDVQLFSDPRPIEPPALRAPSSPRPAVNIPASAPVVVSAPEVAPQDISTPLPIEEIYMGTQPIEHLHCNDLCDYTQLAMLIDSIAFEEGGVA